MQKSLAIKVPEAWTNGNILRLRSKLRGIPKCEVGRVSPTVARVLISLGYDPERIEVAALIEHTGRQSYIFYNPSKGYITQSIIKEEYLQRACKVEEVTKKEDTPSLYLWKSPDGIIRVMQKHNNNYIDLSSPTQDVWETEEIGSNNLIQIENPYERPHRNINDTNVSNGEATLSGGPS